MSEKHNNTIMRRMLYAILTVALGLPMVSMQQAMAAEFALEEIIVTARKREESLQETPISISAFTAQDLENRQIHDSNQLAQIVPNLTFDTNAPASGSNSAGQIFLRGVGQTDFQASNDPGVGVYIDGVYYARTVGSAFGLLDIEKIEVLRGPQGTLFGRNTIGGAIDVTTKRPNFEGVSGSIKATVGTDSRAEIVATGNFPLSDTLAATIVLADQKQDGYVTRNVDGLDLGDNDSQYFRGRLYWEPSESLSFDLIADYTEEDENGQALVFSRINTSAAFPRFASIDAGCPGVGATIPENNNVNCANNQFSGNGEFSTDQNFETFSTLEHKGLSLTVDWDSDAFNVKSITSYRELEAFAARDADNTPLRILHTSFATVDEQFSQELQFSGDAYDGKLDWLLGAYYFSQEAEDENRVFLPERTGATVLAGPVDIESKALFAQGSFALTDRLTLTAGIRYTDEEKSFNPRPRVVSPTLTLALPDSQVTPEYIALLNSLAPAGRPPVIIDIPPPVTIAILPQDTFLLPTDEVRSDAEEVTSLLNLSYGLENGIVYATYSEGFKGGGVNFRVVAPEFAPVAFGPESVTQYEIGYKSDWFDNKLRVNTSAFFTDYEDIQVVVTPVLTPTTINAAKGEAKGFELEITAVPTPEFLITAALGYIDTEYTEISPEVANFSNLTLDNEFQQTPKLSASLGVSYVLKLGNYTVVPRLDWSYRDKRFFDSVNTEAISQDSYDTLNFGLNVSAGENFSVNMAVINVTDEIFRTAGFSSFSSAAGYEEVGFTRGREWLLSLKYQF